MGKHHPTIKGKWLRVKLHDGSVVTGRLTARGNKTLVLDSGRAIPWKVIQRASYMSKAR